MAIELHYKTEADQNLHQDAPAILAAYVERGKKMEWAASQIREVLDAESQNISGDSYHYLANVAAELEG